jgi:hypothetical protein
MPKDLARLTVLLNAEKKKAFDELCAELGTNASQVVRELIARYLAGDQPVGPVDSPARPKQGTKRMDGSA